MELKDLYPVILTILLVGLVLGIGLYVLSSVGDELAITEGTVTNETGLFINDTTATVDTATTAGFHNFAVTICTNATGGETIASGNYTTDADAGTIVGTANRGTNWSDVNCSYTYLYGSTASEAVDSTVSGLGGFADWIAVIVVVIAAAIVLGIVMRSFGGGEVRA